MILAYFNSMLEKKIGNPSRCGPDFRRRRRNCQSNMKKILGISELASLNRSNEGYLTKISRVFSEKEFGIFLPKHRMIKICD